jgi:simple sugar transport system permease protein
MLQFQLQGEGVQIASQWLTMMPYVATIVAVVLMSRRPDLVRAHMPASLGKPFHPGD